MTPTADETALTDLAETFLVRLPRLSALGGLVLAAVALDLAADSRSLARDFGIGHAQVLREITDMVEGAELLTVRSRDARTQRRYLALGPAGERLLQGLGSSLAERISPPIRGGN